MKIINLLKQDTLSLSFEVFPPKVDSSFESVKTATEEIASLHPAFMSVTYGAGGGTSKYTLDIAQNIKERYDVSTLAHLTCVSSTKETVKEKIAQLREIGIENVMALRGDLTPEMEGQDRSHWDYRHAIDLVREIKESGADFCIGGACYPEIPLKALIRKRILNFLKKKLMRDANFSQPRCFLTTICFTTSYTKSVKPASLYLLLRE